MKSSVASIITYASLWAVVSIIIFVTPGKISNLCGCVYAITFAFYIVALFFSYTTLNRSLKQVFYGTPTLLAISALLIIQTIFLFITRFVPYLPHWIAIVVETLIIGGGVVLAILLLTSKSYLNEVDVQTKDKENFMKLLLAEITIEMQKEEKPEIKKQLEQLLSKVKYSDPISDASFKSLEESISSLTVSLKTSEPHQKMDIIKKIILLLEERNMKCKMLK